MVGKVQYCLHKFFHIKTDYLVTMIKLVGSLSEKQKWQFGKLLAKYNL